MKSAGIGIASLALAATLGGSSVMAQTSVTPPKSVGPAGPPPNFVDPSKGPPAPLPPPRKLDPALKPATAQEQGHRTATQMSRPKLPKPPLVQAQPPKKPT